MARPTHEGYDRVLPLAAVGDGRYAAPFAPPLAGQWEVRLSAIGGPAPFRTAERIRVP